MADNIQRLTLDTPTIRSLLKKIRKMCRADGDYIDIATSTSETRATQTLNNTTFKVVPLADADMTGLVGRRNVTLEDYDGVVNAEAQMDNHKRFFCTAQVRIKVTSAVNNVVNVNFKCGVDRTHVVSTTAVLDCTYAHEFDKTLTWMADHTLSTKIWAALGENGSGASVTVEVVQLSITQVPAISNGGGQGGGGEYYSGLGIYVDPNDEINVMAGTGLRVNPLTNELEVSSELIESKENVSNKKQSIDPTSTTEYGSSKAVADFVNSSVATNTANFLGSFTLTDLGLTYPATDVQIAAALNSHTWPTGVTPTNNDYVYVEIQDPQTTGIDDKVERFKFSDLLESWGYEYTLNNSSFTAAEMATLESGITASDKTTWNAAVADLSTHTSNSNIHVTSSDKTAWDAKQNAVNTDTDENAFGDNTTIATGFGSDKVHLNLASRLWTYISGKVFSDNGKVPASNIPDSIKSKVVFIEASFNIATQVFTCNDASYNDITGYLQSGKVPVVRVSVYSNASATTPVRIHDLYYHGYDSQVESPNTGKYKFGSTDGYEDGSRAYVTSVKCNDSTGWSDYQDYAVPSLAKMNTDLAGKVDTTGYASNTKSTFTKASGDASSMTSGGKLSAIFTAISSFFGTLKALAFKDNVSDSDISGTISDNHIASASAWMKSSSGEKTLSFGSSTTIGTVNGANVNVKMPANPNTDTKVTSAANHYAPSRDTSADKSASASGATAAWSIDVVKGVTLQTDGKGHVTGVSVTSGKVPAKPSYTASEVGAAPSSGSNYYVTNSNSSDVGSVDNYSVNTLAANGSTVAMVNNATDNPLGAKKWIHVLSLAWKKGVISSWVSQIAMGTENGDGMWYRTTSGNVSGLAWKRVMDSSNCSVSKSGNTLSVKINGVTQSLENTNTTYSAGTGIGLSGTTITNSGVRNLYRDGNYMKFDVNGIVSSFFINCLRILGENSSSAAYNFDNIKDSGVYFYNVNSSSSTNPPANGRYTIIVLNSGNYVTQLAFGYYFRVRVYTGSAWRNWVTIATLGNA